MAIYLDSASSEKVTAASGLTFSTGNISIGLWVKLPTGSQNNLDCLFGAYDGNYMEIDLRTAGADVPAWTARGGAGKATPYVDAAVEINDDTWHYIFVTCVAGASGVASIYVDDVDTAANTHSADFGALRLPANAYSMGNMNGLSRYVTMTGAHLQVWDGVLTAGERKHAKSGGFPSPSTCLLYWDGYRNDSTQADLSGNGNNGTPTGGASADHAPVGRYAPMPRYAPLRVSGGGGGGLSIPAAAYHYNHSLRSA